MLLDAQIGQLRCILHNTKDSMIGRSVASVRSPVRNISELVDSPITHEEFVSALSETFASTYGVDGKVVKLGEGILDGRYPFEKNFISQSINELQVILSPKGLDCTLIVRFVQSWEWQYGQTLEFKHPMSGKINGKEVVGLYRHLYNIFLDGFTARGDHGQAWDNNQLRDHLHVERQNATES